LSEKKLKNTSLEDRQVLDTDNEDESGHWDGVEEQKNICGDGSPSNIFTRS
jgi:hypothetical protein